MIIFEHFLKHVGLAGGGGSQTNPPPTPTSPLPPEFPRVQSEPQSASNQGGKRGLGMSRSISDTTLR